ncbi:N-acetylneuraminate synthase [Endozoicomonas numazuensis]|uniref:N-acetylneuraminate synthase n=1 Tax=Endozoicomonas numazuensis TaxID=1137799 RepID=A0A081NJK4_9GAMM|nr:N-acetylneuraminate synthase [Endozoicomonas numazuensis]
MEINGYRIGAAHPPYMVAELSGNHGGKLETALALIDAAADSGAHAVKIQTFKPDTITLNINTPDFMVSQGLWNNRSLYDLYDEAQTPWEWHDALFKRARKRGITLFSSPFDTSAVEFLEHLDCPAYKIASFEITDIPLIRKVTETGKPIIMSTGMATLEEIEEAVATIAEAGGTQLCLLHCISGYPTPIEDCNLATLPDLRSRYPFPLGLSDHTLASTAAVTAVALGAQMIEKHFVLDRTTGSIDAEFSLEPDSFSSLVNECRQAWQAIGQAGYTLKDSEAANRQYRRSLYVATDISAGEVFNHQNLRSVRPGHGLHPRHLEEFMGSRAATDIPAGTPLSWEHKE